MRDKIRKVLLTICICVFCFSAYQLVKIYLDYKSIEDQSFKLIEEFVVEPLGTNNPLERKIDFEKLQKKNEDVIGWLYIPNTKVDEPIFKGENDDTYLRTGIDHKKNSAGQLFIDKFNNKNFKDDNTIIYGHNMKNGSRFHDLRYFIEQDYLDKHPQIYIYLPDHSVNVYQTFSGTVIDASSYLYQKGIDYQKYVDQILKVARAKKDIDEKESPLVMLSTCHSSQEEKRYVVYGKLIENVRQ